MIFPQSLSEDEKLNFMNKTVSWMKLTENIMDSCFVLNFGYSQPLPWPQVILLYSYWYISVPLFDLTQVRLTLDSQLHLTPGTGGLKVPSSCTVVIIAGLVSQIQHHQKATLLSTMSGKYLHKVEAVMARVDAITEDLDHMPLAAFLFRQQPVLDKEVEVWPLWEIQLCNFSFIITNSWFQINWH